MSISCSQIAESFPGLIEFVAGPTDIQIEGPSSVNNPKPNTLVYVSKEKNLADLPNSPAAAFIVTSDLVEPIKALGIKQTILSTSNFYLAMAKVNGEFFSTMGYLKEFEDEKIHPTAHISKSAQIGKNVIISPNVVIYENVKIGDNTFIGANTVIEENVEVGSNTKIMALVYLARGCVIGNECLVHPHTSLGKNGYGFATDEKGEHYFRPHYGRLVIGNRVEIGSNVSIDRGTFEDSTIGEGTKIDNYCHLGHNITVGKNCFITAGLITAGSVKIGNSCVFGGRATINGHINITDNVIISGLSGVPNHVLKPGIYGGYPLMPIKDSLRAYASFIQITEMRKNIKKLMKKVGLE